MNLKGKSIMVTGGAGFIGSHLVDRLIGEEPKKIVVVDNLFLGKESNLESARQRFGYLKEYVKDAGNLEVMEGILRSESIDTVFNLAIIPLPTSFVKPKWTVDVNMNITTILCELAREGAFETLVHCSSSEAYGTAEYAPMDEKHPLNPTTPYGASKAACDLIIQSYYRAFGIDTVVVRPFNNYGPRQNERAYAGVIPTMVRIILEGKAPVIFGDGSQTRDYIYVGDTAKAMIDIYKEPNTRGKIINVGSGGEISITELAKQICNHTGYKKDILYREPRTADVRRLLADTSLAKALIGFKPEVGIEEGLKNTVEWYVEYFKGKTD